VLEEMGVNFFHLGPEAVSNTAVRPYFNLIVLAEYFANQHLASQESQIQVVQRNKNPAFDVLLAAERPGEI